MMADGCLLHANYSVEFPACDYSSLTQPDRGMYFYSLLKMRKQRLRDVDGLNHITDEWQDSNPGLTPGPTPLSERWKN